MKKLIALGCLLLTIACSKDDDTNVIDPNPPNVGIPKEIAVDSVQTFNEMLSAQAEADRLGLRFKFSDFYATGVYVKPNTILELNVEIVQGNNIPGLLVGTYSRGNHWNRQPLSYTLAEGKNTINIGNEGGMVYIRYINQNSPNAKAKIKFLRGWVHSPVYKLNYTTSANWKKMLNTFTDAPTVTIEGNKSLLVVSREEALNYQDENLNTLLTSIDNVITLQNDLSGMDGSNLTHNPISHKLLLVEYTGSDYYMFAYNYRTAYNKQGVSFILSNRNFTQDGWGTLARNRTYAPNGCLDMERNSRSYCQSLLSSFRKGNGNNSFANESSKQMGRSTELLGQSRS